MRSLSSLLSSLKSAWGRSARRSGISTLQSSADPDALWRDGIAFWAEVDARPEELRRAVHRRYPLISSGYVDRYLDQILTEHRSNPLAPLYIESELGAPARQLGLLEELERLGLRIDGRRCLDIGCSNGSLLLAARQKGAARCVGVDVSAARIASARQLCDGADIDLRVADLGTSDLPADCGPFDVIFCTDVLEHVSSIPGILAAMGRHLAKRPDARIFVTVFNHLSVPCVASEPHYGVPGMVLIDRAAAAEIWSAVRTGLKSALDYEVERWPEYATLVRDAAAAGLRVTPQLDRPAIVQSRGGFMAGYAGRLEGLERSAAARLDELRLAAPHRTLLRDSIRRYCDEALAEHRAFDAAVPRLSDDDMVAFYLRYYAQPIRCFLTHA